MKSLIRAVSFLILSEAGAFQIARAQNISWTSISGPYSGNVTVMTVDNRGNIFAATQYAGVYRSTDNGSTWESINNGLNWAYLSTLAVDTANSLYAGSNLSPGFYKSTDLGSSWSKVNLSGGVQTAELLSRDRLCVSGSGTFSVSSDGGATWNTSVITPDPVPALSIAEDNMGDIYAGLQAVIPARGRPYGGGVFVSSDSGNSWHSLGMTLTSILSIAQSKNGRVFILVPSGILSAPPGDSTWTRDVLGLPSTDVVSLTVDSSADLFAVTNDGVYEYLDPEEYWVQVSPAISKVNITSAYYYRNRISFAGTEDDGVFKLDPSGQEWIQCGIAPTSIYSLGRDKSGSIYAGTVDGIYRLGSQNTWTRASTGLSNGIVYNIRQSPFLPRLYASTSGGAYYSSDSGRSWETLYPGWSFDIFETRIDRMYVGSTGGIIISSDGGYHWSIPADISLPLTDIYCLTANSDSMIYAGVKWDGVFLTTDEGGFWNQVGLQSMLMFNSVRVLPIDPGGRMFAGTDSSGMYYSDNGGVDWTHVNSLGVSNITSVLLSGGEYFAGTFGGGVFVSTDRGKTWTASNQNLRDLNVKSLLIDANGFIYAGTDSGIFKSSNLVTSVPINKPQSFSLNQNYPNPFNPRTVINYQLTANSEVNLKVFDVLGREVASLVNERESAGEHFVTFDGSRLASGVYFYRLATSSPSTGTRVETKRMVLVK